MAFARKRKVFPGYQMALDSFGQRVLQARLNLSARLGRQVAQSEIAEAVGVHQVTLGEWERGKKEPKLETIERLAAVLGVAAGWLAFGEIGQAVEEATITPPAGRGITGTLTGIPASREGPPGAAAKAARKRGA